MYKISKNTDHRELIALLRLSKIPSISNLKAIELIKKFNSASKIFDRELELLNSKDFKWGPAFFSKKYLEAAIQVFREADSKGYQLMGYGLKTYPYLLHQCEDAPLVLCSSGAIDWDSERWISVVGTRTASSYALSFVEQLIEELAPYRPTIVSGLAYGIDIAAHKAAIANELQTIACLAHGLNRTYPKEHYKIRKAMEQKGGVLSEFSPNEPPLPYKFVQRNRIIAGLTKASLVIESPIKGGSLITADLANSYQREVYAVPARTTDVHQGCNQLIRDCKAQLVSSAKDLIQFLGWD